MKLWLIGALTVAIATAAVPTDATAKRLGGGKSSGLQRSMPARTAPDATPAKPAQQAAPTAPGAAAAAPAAAPKRSWMGPLAGLAAGLGLAALMSHLGMGAGLANFVMFALLAGAAVFGVMFLLRRFGPGARAPALAGAGAAGSAPRAAWPPVQPQVEPPFARSAPDAPDATAGATAAAPSAQPPVTAETPAIARAFVPATFDSEGFARTAKMIFIRLQAANDTADLDDLRRFTTPELFASLRLDLQERGPSAQQTDVVKVEAEVLDVANEAERQVVSVRFHGQVVEEKGAAATDFNEVWHLAKPHDDSRPWAIAGIEQVS
ncbi:MAG: TIM44-like domain-containing protein [Rubrivivax sp.]|nr:TIM44-like domain-containing protein [Rubrivivax sp.]